MPAAASHDDPLQGLLAKFAGARQLDGGTSIEGLGLSSLERVELMVALEDQFQTRIDETKFAGAKTLDDLRAVIASAPQEAEVAEPVDFPSWNRAWPVRLDPAHQPGDVDPAAGADLCVGARQRPRAPRTDSTGPVVFASNHQSHFDVPVILIALPGKIRATIAPAMAKEFFKAHFFPAEFSTAAGDHEPPELLPVGVLLQHLPPAATRSRRAADAALHRRGDGRRILGADLSRRACVRTAARSRRSAAASA